MKGQYNNSKLTTSQTSLDNLDFVSDSIKQVSLTFGITLYTDKVFSSFPDGVLGCFHRFLELCPPDQLKYYQTENMSRHKPVTKRTLGMLATWLKPDAPPRKFIALELKNGDEYRSAPSFKFRILGGEKDSTAYNNHWANLISMTFPAEWGFNRSHDMLTLTQEMCDQVPYLSGHAGFTFECCPYAARLSQTYAWRRSMRHRGIDIYTGRKDTIAVGHNAIKGVGWLTIICDSFIEELGGQTRLTEAISDMCELINVPRGVIIKAGPEPAIGDISQNDDLPQYRTVYHAVKPLVEIAIARAPIFTLDVDDAREKTNAWYRRLEDET
jgi:hypothetical protein